MVSVSVFAAELDYGIPAYIAKSVIDGNAVKDAYGKVSINQAAGDGNVQINAAAIAVNPNGAARARLGIGQKTSTGQANMPDISIARVSDNAFANATGVISVNQISGTGNAQANGFAFALGLEGELLTESALEQTISNAGTSPLLQQQANTGIRVLDVDATAFDNSHGIVQLNQTAGTGNATRNNFALRILLEPK